MSIPIAAVAADSAYLGDLQARADQLHLEREPQWLRLLHYRPDRLPSGYTSTVDFTSFFVADNGKTDPRAELQATLASFFADTQRDGEPPQCRARARYAWLKQRLSFDASRLPEQVCDRYQEWSRGLSAQQLAVVFASNDLNGPSSMFGHTLLRVDAQGQGDSDRLLAYAVNYAANAGDQNSLTYAVRGLTGAYTGTFSIYPYYEKVKEYARYEHRDLWEYPLALDPEQTERLLQHVWELRGVSFDYYFFSENCSYQLLSLIEVARPDLSLTAPFDRGIAYAIPIDTVRVLRRSGLLGEPVYRVALAHQLQFRFAQLTQPQRDWVVAYAHGRATLDDARLVQASPQQRARMLEVTQDYLYFEFRRGGVAREAGLPRAHAALVTRSAMTASADFDPAPRPGVAPDQGHGSGRLSIGARSDNDGDVAALLRIRPAYHDRLDPPGGYLAGGELEFLNLSLLADRHGLALDELRVLSVQAVSPRDDAFRPWSWQVSTGLRRYGRIAASSRGQLGAYVDGGPGLAWSPLPRLQTYAFAFTEADTNRTIAKNYALASGLRIGAAAQWSPRFTQELQADALAGVAGAAAATLRLRWSSQWQLSSRSGLRLDLRAEARHGEEQMSAELMWQRYF